MSILRFQLPGHQIPDGLVPPCGIFALVEHGVGFIADGRDDGVFAGELPGGRSPPAPRAYFGPGLIGWPIAKATWFELAAETRKASRSRIWFSSSVFKIPAGMLDTFDNSRRRRSLLRRVKASAVAVCGSRTTA